MQKQQERVQQQRAKSSEVSETSPLQAVFERNAADQQQIQQDQLTYQQALEYISQSLHPFTLDSQQWQTHQGLLTHLAPPLQCLWDLAQTYNTQKVQQAIDTFETQIAAFAQGVQAWRDWLSLDLDNQTQDPVLQSWLLSFLLPWVYWTQQADKTRKPALKQGYRQAATHAFTRLTGQPLSQQLEDAQQQYWIRWAQDFCTNYQRTSSAVEGRNGYLSKLHHARRGFSEQSLQVLTVIHNFDLKRADGTTAAQRLFGHEFPDLFEWMLGQVGDLPLPRRSAKARQPKPIYAEGFSP